MKQFKFLAVVAAILLFSNLSFAGNSVPENADDIATKMVEYVHNDVNLTTTQKDILKKKALTYATYLIQARAMANKDQSYEMMKSVTSDYQTTLDSLLTDNQKALKTTKEKDRVIQTLKKYNITY